MTAHLALLGHAPIALAPVLIFLAVLVHADSYKLLSLRAVLLLVATGVAAAGVSYLVSSYAYAHFAGDFARFSREVSPWIEEALKKSLTVDPPPESPPAGGARSVPRGRPGRSAGARVSAPRCGSRPR